MNGKEKENECNNAVGTNDAFQVLIEHHLNRTIYFISQSSGNDSGISGILYICPFSPAWNRQWDCK